MTRLDWSSAPRRYEAGIDHGVLYPPMGPGVPWNGLVTVDESHTGGDTDAYYFDGIKYLEKQNPKNFQATITAFSAPKEFSQLVGELPVIPGFILTRQPRKQFGFSYRTLIEDGEDYKIHIVYNATASPESRGYATMDGSAFAQSFSWKIDAVPPKVSGYRPSAHFTLDTTKTDLFTLRAIEDILYGTATSEPRLPSVEELVDIVGLWEPKLIVPSDYSTLKLAKNPTGYWRLGEKSGSVAFDLSSNERHGAYQGPTLGQKGLLIGDDNTAVSFDGVSDLIVMDPASVPVGPEVSVVVWTKDVTPKNGNAFSAQAGDSSSYRQISAHLPWSDNNVYWDAGGQNTLQRINKFAGDVDWAAKHQWILTLNATLGRMQIFLDGVLWHSGLGRTSPLIPSDRFHIGGEPGSGSGYAQATLDEFAIYDYEFTEEDAAELYATGTRVSGGYLTPGLGDLTPSKTPGLYRDLPTTRLAETAVGGLYRLE